MSMATGDDGLVSLLVHLAAGRAVACLGPAWVRFLSRRMRPCTPGMMSGILGGEGPMADALGQGGPC